MLKENKNERTSLGYTGWIEMFVKRAAGGRTARRDSLHKRPSVTFAADVTGNEGLSGAIKSNVDATDNKCWLPPPGQKPIRVELQCSCLALSDINTLQSSAQVKFLITLTWIDERFITEDRLSNSSLPGDLWGPDIQLSNSMIGFVITYSSFALIDPTIGKMKRTILFHGGIRNPMDLKNFPFDSDDLELAFSTYSSWRLLDCSKHGKNTTVQIYEIVPAHSTRFFEMDCPQDINEFHLTGWSFDMINPEISSKYGAEIGPSDFLFKFHLIRRHSFYIWRIFLPVWLFVLTSIVAFALEIKDTKERLEYLVCVLLANVAYVYIVQESIPKVPFYTSIDKVIFVSYFTVVMTVFLTRILAAIKDEETAKFWNKMVAYLIQCAYWILNFVFVIPPYLQARKKDNLGSRFNMENFKSANSLSMKNKLRRRSEHLGY